MVLYISSMLPFVSVTCTGVETVHERDSFAELMLREHAVCQELENVRSYKCHQGKILGMSQQQQMAEETGEDQDMEARSSEDRYEEHTEEDSEEGDDDFDDGDDGEVW